MVIRITYPNQGHGSDFSLFFLDELLMSLRIKNEMLRTYLDAFDCAF